MNALCPVSISKDYTPAASANVINPQIVSQPPANVVAVGNVLRVLYTRNVSTTAKANDPTCCFRTKMIFVYDSRVDNRGQNEEK